MSELYIVLYILYIRNKMLEFFACCTAPAVLSGLFPQVNTTDIYLAQSCHYIDSMDNLTTLCLNGIPKTLLYLWSLETLSCADFMDVIMGDIPQYVT